MFTNDFKANAYLNITKLPSFCCGVVGRIKLDNSEVVPWFLGCGQFTPTPQTTPPAPLDAGALPFRQRNATGDPQVFRFGNQNESARAFTRTHTLKEAASVDHPLSPYVNSALF